MELSVGIPIVLADAAQIDYVIERECYGVPDGVLPFDFPLQDDLLGSVLLGHDLADSIQADAAISREWLRVGCNWVLLAGTDVVQRYQEGRI